MCVCFDVWWWCLLELLVAHGLIDYENENVGNQMIVGAAQMALQYFLYHKYTPHWNCCLSFQSLHQSLYCLPAHRLINPHLLMTLLPLGYQNHHQYMTSVGAILRDSFPYQCLMRLCLQTGWRSCLWIRCDLDIFVHPVERSYFLFRCHINHFKQ